MSSKIKYSVRVKNGAGWRSFKRVRLMISVGQEYHEGGKLQAVADWINRNKTIEEVHISVNDFLQRHNYYANGFSEQQADAIALSEGALWLERNEEIISSIKSNLLITRWNDWFAKPEYQAARQELEIYGLQNPDFTATVRQDATIHANRKFSRGETVPPTFTQHSINYLLEELAVFALQTQKLPAAEVYQGSNLLSAEYLLAMPLPPSISPIAERYFTRIDFARINAQSGDRHIAQAKNS
jgi:tRNA-dependent cyclodipeptide synthase